MFRSLVRPTVVGRPGNIRSIAVGVIVMGALVGGPVQAAQDAAAPAAQAAAPANPFLFMSDGAMVINYVKPDKTADFEMVINKVKEALAKSEKPERKQQATEVLEGFACNCLSLRERPRRKGGREVSLGDAPVRPVERIKRHSQRGPHDADEPIG